MRLSGNPSWVSIIAAGMAAAAAAATGMQGERIAHDEMEWNRRFNDFLSEQPVFCRLTLSPDEVRELERVLIDLRARKDVPLGPVIPSVLQET